MRVLADCNRSQQQVCTSRSTLVPPPIVARLGPISFSLSSVLLSKIGTEKKLKLGLLIDLVKVIRETLHRCRPCFRLHLPQHRQQRLCHGGLVCNCRDVFFVSISSGINDMSFIFDFCIVVLHLAFDTALRNAGFPELGFFVHSAGACTLLS
jgi:hypothetical protein